MMDRWNDKVAIVTGASEGIGEAIVRRLAGHGMRVVALARRLNLLQAIENDVNSKGKGKVYCQACDVSDEAQVKTAFSWTEQNVGPVSVLVNNAAVAPKVSLSEMDTSAVKAIMDVNVMGVMYCCQQAITSMKASGTNDGHIININSIWGHRDVMLNGISVYTASKHALTILTLALKRELSAAKMNTRVTSISPGVVDTTMAAWYLRKYQGVPVLAAEDVVECVTFALSVPSTVNISELTIEPV